MGDLRRLRWLLLAASTVAAACSFSDAAEIYVANECSSDADCGGAVCDAASRICVSVADSPLLLGLEVIPETDPSGRIPSTFLVGPFEIDGPSQRDVLVTPGITVFGSVTVPGTEGTVSATVRFTRRVTFPGGPKPTVETATSRERIDVAGQAADYSLRVTAEQEYDVVVEPLGEAMQRLPVLRRVVSVPGGGDNVRVDLTYPEAIPSLQGVIVGAGGTPVDGLSVQAVRPETGQVVSSTAVTGAGDWAAGQFTLFVDPTVSDYVIRIGGADGAVFPTMIADPSYFFPDDGGFVSILVPMLRPIHYVGRVEPMGSTMGREVVQNAVLSFRSVDVFDDTTGVTSTYRTTVTTDSAGRFDVEVFPGSYEVVVTPPGGGSAAPTPGGEQIAYPELGVLSEYVRIEARSDSDTITGQTFQLPGRAVLGGVVRTADGRVFPGATVQANALGYALEDLPAGRYNRSGSTATDPTGLFNLPLDHGAYDVLVKPPADSGYPWVISPAMIFGSSSEVRVELEVAAPVPLRGTLLSGSAEESAPLGGAEIRAWGIFEDEAGSQRAIRIGRATSGADGSYTLLLPPRFDRMGR